MSEEIFLNTGTSFQQPYIARQPASGRTPAIGTVEARTPTNVQTPFTYSNRTPFTYRNPVNGQQPYIANARQPGTYQTQGQQPYPYIADSQTPFTYQARQPFTYRSPVNAQQPYPYIADSQTPFTYQARQPFTYRSPVNAQQPYPYIANSQTPFTYQARQPFTYERQGQAPFTYQARQPFTYQARQPFTYNVQTTVPYSYRTPFIFNMWGSPSTPTSNISSIFNMETESLNSDSVAAATTVNIRHLVANKRIDFGFHNTLDGGPGTSPISTDQESVFYTGTLNNLEARFVFNTMNLGIGYDTSVVEAVIGQAFDTSGQINASSISSYGTSVTGATTVNSLNSYVGNSVTFNSPWGNIGIDNNIDKSAMLYVYARGEIRPNDAYAYIQSSGSGVSSLAIQLRANQDNNDIVTLYTRGGGFGLNVDSFDDDTT